MKEKNKGGGHTIWWCARRSTGGCANVVVRVFLIRGGASNVRPSKWKERGK